MLQALGTIWFRFLQKKSKKKFHACVLLNNAALNIASTGFLISFYGAIRVLFLWNNPADQPKAI